jgi:hypothetical protein
MNSQPVAMQVQAQTSLAKGITANRSGSLVEAMNYFSYATSYDTNLLEANQRLGSLTSQIKSGNLGDNISNEIQLRNAWNNLLEDAIAFYDANPYVNLVYKTVPELGRIDYNRNKAELIFDYWLEPNPGVEVIRNILKALDATKKTNEWGLQELARQLYHYDTTVDSSYYRLEVNAELFDKNGVFLEKATDEYRLRWLTGKVALDTLRDPNTGAYRIEQFGEFNYISFSVQQNKNPKLVFNIDTNMINDNLAIKFPTIRKVYRNNSSDRGVVTNIRITPTDKSFEEYFSKCPQYRNIQEPPRWSGYGNYYEFHFD